MSRRTYADALDDQLRPHAKPLNLPDYGDAVKSWRKSKGRVGGAFGLEMQREIQRRGLFYDTTPWDQPAKVDFDRDVELLDRASATAKRWTYDEFERQRDQQWERIAFREWSDDDYELPREWCSECGADAFFDVTPLGELCLTCPGCGFSEWPDVEPRLIANQRPLACRRRFFTTAPLPANPRKRKPGIKVEFVPQAIPGDTLVGSLMLYLRSVEALPQTEAEAVALVEHARWFGEPRCIKCDAASPYQMTDGSGGRNKRFLWRCRSCKRQFTVRIGTVFEDSPITLRQWLSALRALALDDRIGSPKLGRIVGIDQRSALMVLRRVRDGLGNDAEITGTVSRVTPIAATQSPEINQSRVAERVA